MANFSIFGIETFKKMKFLAKVDVMPHKAILDPQGKAVGIGLNNMGIQDVVQVRVGKHIEIEIESNSQEDAKKKVEDACKKLLANPIMESYHYSLQPLN